MEDKNASMQCAAGYPVGRPQKTILLHGLECFQLGKADLDSLDFTFNRLCMKLFKTGSIEVVRDCQSYFDIDLPSCDLKRIRQDKFIIRYISTDHRERFLPILLQAVIHS